MVYKELEKLLQLLIVMFGLTIRLRVVGGRGCQLYADEAIKFAGEVRHELGAVVRNHNAQGAVVFPDLVKEEASRSYCCDGSVRCDKVRALRDTIDDVHNSVIDVGAR